MALVGHHPFPPGWRVRHAAHLTALASPGTLPSQCTLSVWFDDGAGYEHVHIQRDGSAVNVRINGGAAASYGGTIGTSYAAFLKNVLTSLCGGFAGTYAELHCADQLVDVDVFGKTVGARWRPAEVSVPHTFVGNLIHHSQGAIISNPAGTWHTNKAFAFDGVTNATHGSCARPAYPDPNGPNDRALGKDFGEASRRRIHSASVYASSNARYTYYNPIGDLLFTMQGSHDNASWTNLGSTVAVNANSAVTTITSDDTTTEWRYVRVRMQYNSTGGDGYLSIAEVRFFEPLTYTYGPQGAHLDFANASALGEDVSGNDNHWTVTGSQSANRP